MIHKTYTIFFITLILTFVCAKDSFVTLKGVPLGSSISENNVADLVHHLTSLSSVNEEADRINFPQVNIFSLPKLNVLVALDAVSEDLIENMEDPHFFETTGNAEIIKNSYPEDSLCSLTSIVTGKQWEDHGIVGLSWKASQYLGVHAYSHNGQRQVANIADLLSYESNGNARTLVVSGNQKMALTMGVHSELRDEHPDWNNQIIYYSPQRGLIEPFSEKIIASNQEIRSASQKRMMRIETKEGFILAAELAAIENIPKLLSEMKPSDDGVTDFVGIAITSIKTLTTKFGKDSEQVRVAMKLLDISLTKMNDQLTEMYNSKISTEIIGLGSNIEEHTTKTQDRQQRKFLLDDYNDYYGITTFDQESISAFQTSFWVAVGLIIAVIIALSYLLKMDMLYDSLLYKTTDGPRPIPNVK